MSKLANSNFGELTEAFKRQRELRDDSIQLKLVETLLEKNYQGDIANVADELKSDMDQARTDGKKDVVYRYHGLIQRYLESYDRINAETADLSSVDEDDLKAVVTERALELLMNDRHFMQRCIEEVRERKAVEAE